MKRKRLSAEQIAFATTQPKNGTPVTAICREIGVSEPTFYRWKKRLAGMGVAKVRRLKQLGEENRELKTLMADLSMDRQTQQVALMRTTSTSAPAACR